jgi:hypothetical protein
MVAPSNKRRWPPRSNIPGAVTEWCLPRRRPHAFECCYTAGNLVSIFKTSNFCMLHCVFRSSLFSDWSTPMVTPRTHVNSRQRAQKDIWVLDNGNGVRQSGQISEKGAEFLYVVPVCQSDDHGCGCRIFPIGLLSLSMARQHLGTHTTHTDRHD